MNNRLTSRQLRRLELELAGLAFIVAGGAAGIYLMNDMLTGWFLGLAVFLLLLTVYERHHKKARRKRQT